MNSSARCEYGCRAVVELARHAHTEKPLTATAIAEKRAIPEKYLVHILLQLKRAGVVRSVRGAQGGYTLARSADTINLLDIVTAVDGGVLDPLPVSRDDSDEVAPAWRDAAAGISEVLEKVTVQSILDRSPKAEMYYI